MSFGFSAGLPPFPAAAAAFAAAASAVGNGGRTGGKASSNVLQTRLLASNAPTALV